MSLAIPSLTLVTGGARAGKSRFALSLLSNASSVTYIASAEPLDEEMRVRIARHQAERPATWRTVEAPIELAAAIAAAPVSDALIIDCLTVWVSNLLLRETEAAPGWVPGEPADQVLRALRARAAPAIAVTNEVGLGVVPPTGLGRVYRDALGEVNQRFAAIAGTVVFLVAGIPLVIKGSLPTERSRDR